MPNMNYNEIPTDPTNTISSEQLNAMEILLKLQLQQYYTLMAIADKLFGPEPQPAEIANNQPTTLESYVHAFSYLMSDISNCLRDTNYQISRLEKF